MSAVIVAPRSGRELAYVEKTSGVSVTATFEDVQTDIVSAGALTFDGSTAVWVEWYFPTFQAGASGKIHIALYEDGTSLGSADQHPVSSGILYAFGRRKITPTAGSHTYSIGAWRDTANGVVGGGVGGTFDILPGYIRITVA